jgi:hypothetical protein
MHGEAQAAENERDQQYSYSLLTAVFATRNAVTGRGGR